MPIKSLAPAGAKILLASLILAGLGSVIPAAAQERLPWLRDGREAPPRYEQPVEVDRDSLPPPPEPAPYNSAPRAGDAYDGAREDAYRPPPRSYGGYEPQQRASRDDAYRPPARYQPPPPPPSYAPPYPRDGRDEPERRSGDPSGDRYREPYPDRYASSAPHYDDREPPPRDGTFSMREIIGAGHGFFGSISEGLASVIEYAFKTQGRPNGYILGEDLGGAFVAGLRYGEGRLFTRDAGTHRVYWQGPSIGYDAGAEGSKVMVLVYNMRDPSDIYQRFGGVAGSAYVVGGVGLTFQQRDDIVLAPIRAGVGFRLGANVGYLKYTRRPTWNPF